jgi:hypothetical protein
MPTRSIAFAFGAAILIACGSHAERLGFAPPTEDASVALPPGSFERDGGCVKVSETETKCDGIDDDCNGKIDDVDVGKDGICDCVRIGLVGRPGYYGSNNFQAWLQARGTTVTRIQETTNDPLTAQQLAPFDMVILDWLQRPYTAAESQTFAQWLESGHGALALSGFAGDYEVERPNSLMKVVGLTFGIVTTFEGKETVTDFTTTHPIARGVSAVTFNGGSEVFSGVPTVAGTLTSVARLAPRDVLVAHEGTAARAAAFGDEWIEFDSEWRALPDIERLWANLVGFLAPRCTVPPPPR